MLSRFAISTFLVLAIHGIACVNAQEVETKNPSTTDGVAVDVVNEAPKRMTPELLMKLGRVSGGAVSADGKKIAAASDVQ